MAYYLGTDLGGTKTHTIIADETGQVLGFGEGPGGNHQAVGYGKMYQALDAATRGALRTANIPAKKVKRAAFGLAGYDWASEGPRSKAVIDRLGLSAPYTLVNDAIPALVAGAEAGWGVAVVSGTGCNCWGWDVERRIGRVTGYGILMGEFAGASELIFKAMQFVGYSWSKRFPPTLLSDIFIEAAGAKNLDDLIEGYTEREYDIPASVAPRVFEAAKAGDEIAHRLIHWAGCELGEMANSVIRQLSFEDKTFEVVLSGSMFEGGPLLINPMRETILRVAPRASLTRLAVPPVIGSVLIAMLEDGVEVTLPVRQKLAATLPDIRMPNGERGS